MKILFFDREEMVRHLLEVEFLEMGFQVVSVGEVERLLGTIEEEKPEAIVMDLWPISEEMRNLVREIKARFPDVPAILFMCCIESDKNVQSVAAMTDFYLVKSFDFSELKRTIERLEKK